MRPRIADYDIIEPLAPSRSSSGTAIFRANPPPRLGWSGDVAVETLKFGETGWAEHSEYLARVASLRSEHVAILLEVAPTPGEASSGYLSRENAAAGSLEKPAETLDRSAAMRALAGAARGVHDLHEAGLTHGSIVPSRVLLAERGGILDPGTGRGGAPASVVLTGDEAWLLGWMDPEVLAGGPLRRASDLWSLGATLYWVLSGSSVHEPKSSEALATRVFHAIYDPPVIDASIGEALARLVSACTASDVSARPESASAFADELEALAGL